jgi:acyl dehydratase
MDTAPVTVAAHEIRGLVGLDLQPTGWIELDQGRVDSFADVADDRHWVHNDPDIAARGPFGRPIVHAHLTLALLPSLFRQLVVVGDGSSSLFYGYNRVRLPAPVPVGGRIRLRGRVLQVDDVPGGTQLTVECVVEVEGQEKPGCVAEALWRHYPVVEPDG